jgi:hypothetical protein
MGADEERVVRITGLSFGLLAFFMLGLTPPMPTRLWPKSMTVCR